MESFREIIRNNAEVQAYLTHDWMTDLFANGTWCCWGPNQFSRYAQELHCPRGRVFFASADRADGWRGFVDGAIESDQKAAKDAERLLGGLCQYTVKL